MQINRERLRTAIAVGADKLAPVLGKAGPGAAKAAAFSWAASRQTVRLLNAGREHLPPRRTVLERGNSALAGLTENARQLRQLPIAGRLSTARIRLADGVGEFLLLAAGRLWRRISWSARQQSPEVSV